jgi:hypothetical protein
MASAQPTSKELAADDFEQQKASSTATDENEPKISEHGSSTATNTNLITSGKDLATGESESSMVSSNSVPVGDVVDSERDDTVMVLQDNNLPSWLVLTIDYLRGVSKDNAWQKLVTEFVAFEKSRPPTGVSQIFTPSMKLFNEFKRNYLR